jgi:predicted glutamine amidotransferase
VCRLLGAVSRRQTTLRHSLLSAPNSLRSQSERDGWGQSHEDGWGLGWYDPAGRARVLKQPAWAAHSPEFDQAAREIATKMAVGHVRRATVGRRDPIHTHPFALGDWMLAQNGGIGQLWHDRIAAALGSGVIAGETSGEHLLAWLYAHVGDQTGAAQEPGIIACLQALIARPRSITSANFILTTGDRLFAFHYAVHEYHALCWTTRRRSVIVASEPTTDDEVWYDVPNGCLLVVDSGGMPELLRLTNGGPDSYARPLAEVREIAPRPIHLQGPGRYDYGGDDDGSVSWRRTRRAPWDDGAEYRNRLLSS